jgi:hypothetical protein
MGKKLNSRWAKGGPRQRKDVKIDDTRWVSNRRGIKRLVTDQPSELVYCQRRHEGPGWKNGARVNRK